MGSIKPSYFRKQAETCLKLSQACSDASVAVRLKQMATDFIAKANELEMLPAQSDRS
jgi:hypothetical protein